MTSAPVRRIISPVTAEDAEIALPADAGDAVSLRRWFLLFALYLAVLAALAAWMLADLGRPWEQLFTHAGEFRLARHQALKLVIFVGYLSLCCTFLPLPTGWLVAAVATREVALTPDLWSTVLLVGLAGAVGSTMANLNDYHLFTLMLRHRRVAAVRNTRAYRYAARGFARAPFTLVVIFNIIPIPIDVIRMLAATARYRRGAFAAANFFGRFIRYAVLAGAAFALQVGAVPAALAMLAIAAALGAIRLAPPAFRRLATANAGRSETNIDE